MRFMSLPNVAVGRTVRRDPMTDGRNSSLNMLGVCSNTSVSNYPKSHPHDNHEDNSVGSRKH
jgi:hypothetical protein